MANLQKKREASRRFNLRKLCPEGKDLEKFCKETYGVSVAVFVTDEHHNFKDMKGPSEKSGIPGPIEGGSVMDWIMRKDLAPILVEVQSVSGDTAVVKNIEPDRKDKFFPGGWSSGKNFQRSTIDTVYIKELKPSTRV